MLMLRDVKRRLLYIAGAGLLGARRHSLPAFLLHQPDGDDPGLSGRRIRQYAARRLGLDARTMCRRIRSAAASKPIARTGSRCRRSTSDRRRRPAGQHPDPGRRGPRLAQRLFRDARRAGLSGPDPVPAHPRHRPDADGGAAPALSRRATASMRGSRRWRPRSSISRSSIWSAPCSSPSPSSPSSGWRWRSRSASTAGCRGGRGRRCGDRSRPARRLRSNAVVSAPAGRRKKVWFARRRGGAEGPRLSPSFFPFSASPRLRVNRLTERHVDGL